MPKQAKTRMEWRAYRNMKNWAKKQGVVICGAWSTFRGFLEDMPAPQPSECYVFTRLDDSGPCDKTNHRWLLSPVVQAMIDFNERTTARNKAAGFE